MWYMRTIGKKACAHYIMYSCVETTLIWSPYEANEADGVVFVRVGLIGTPQSLERDVSILLSFASTGSAISTVPQA